MLLYGFELIKFNRYGKKGFKLRFLADGYCIEEKNYYGEFSEFYIDRMKKNLMKFCNFVSTGNYEEPAQLINCFELVENAGENEDRVYIRFIRNGKCVGSSIIDRKIDERLELSIVNNMKFLCKLNYQITRKKMSQMKKKGENPPKGTSIIEMQEKIKSLIG